MFTKLVRDEVFMVQHTCLDFLARFVQGWIQGGTEIGKRGALSSKDFFFRPEDYSNKINT